MSKRFLSGINVTGTATLNTVANAGLDTDKFLVLDAAGNIEFRTGVELRLDIGADVVSKVQHEVKLGESMTIGTPVYVPIAQDSGTNMTVLKASNAGESTSSKTMGLIASSGITNDLVQVVTEGLLAGINTGSATKGDPVWLGVNGELIFGLSNKPVAPAHLVFLGIVTRAQTNNGEIFVKVQNGFEMNELHNYAEGSVQNNEVIVYESATSLYKPKSIPTILGYTPADDASVVRITGAQTVGGLKTFSASIVANVGVLLKNGAVSALNGYTAIGGSSSNGIELVFSPGGSTQSLLFQTSAAYSYTFPAATGTVALISDIPSLAGYVPNTRTLTINGTTYDLSENRSWTITTDASARSILRYVATANQTTFTISGGYTPGLTDVYRNGVKLDNSTDFTATNGTTIVLTNGASVNDVIEVYRYQTAFLANNALRTVTEFIATAGQTTFNVTYNSGLVDVFYNGSKLLSTEYTAGNGTSIVLNFPCNVNDTLEVHAYSYQVGAFSGQAQLNGTGFVKVSGTTVTYDNSTYLTTASAASTYLTTSAAGTTYLPLSGGTLNGTLTQNGVINLQNSGTTYFQQYIGGSGDLVFYNTTNNGFFVYTNSAQRFSISGAGVSTFSGAIYANDNIRIYAANQFWFNNGFRGQIVPYNAYGGGGDYSPFFTSETSLAFGVGGNSTKALNIASNGSVTLSSSMSATGSISTSGSLSTVGYLNYNSGDGNDWYINPPSNGPTIRLKYHGGSTNRSGGLGWINNAGGRTEALTWQDDTVTLNGTSISPRNLGKSYAQTSGGGTGTANVDTGITYNSGDFSGYGRGATYEVVVGANPNAGGSGAYYSMYFGIVQVYTGWSGSAVTTYISYTSLAAANGGGNLTVSATFWNGSSETTGVGVYTTGYQIRIKVSGYNSSYTGQDQVVYLKRIS